MTSPSDTTTKHDAEQSTRPALNLDCDQLSEADRGILALAAAFLAHGAIRLASAAKGAGRPKAGDTDSGAEEA